MPKSNLSTYGLTLKQIQKILEHAERERMKNKQASHMDDNEDDDDDNEVDVVTSKKVISLKCRGGMGPPATPKKKNGRAPLTVSISSYNNYEISSLSIITSELGYWQEEWERRRSNSYPSQTLTLLLTISVRRSLLIQRCGKQ